MLDRLTNSEKEIPTLANGLGRNIEDFGKYVFLTQAEAERKLKVGD